MKVSKRNKQRGVALLSVMIAIAITIVISNEFGTSTSTDMIAAANYRDEMRAHFLARSATNLAELVVRIQQRLDNIRGAARPGPDHRLRRPARAAVLRQRRRGPAMRSASSPSAIKGLGADIGTCGFNGPFDDRGRQDQRQLRERRRGVAGHAAGARRADVLPGVRPGVRRERRRGLAPRSRDAGRRRSSTTSTANTMHARDRGTTEDYGYEIAQGPLLPEEQLHRHARRAEARARRRRPVLDAVRPGVHRLRRLQGEPDDAVEPAADRGRCSTSPRRTRTIRCCSISAGCSCSRATSRRRSSSARPSRRSRLRRRS